MQLAGKRTDHLRSFIDMCLYAMLRDKGIPIPRALKNKRVVIDFADRPESNISIEKALSEVHFDVWSTSRRIQATFRAIDALPELAWEIIFFSTYFAAPDFLVTLLEAADVIRNLDVWSLANIFKAVTRQDRRHVSDWFGHGHMQVRLQGNIFRQLGRTQARTSLLAHLEKIDNNNFKNISWKNGAQWRPKSSIFSDLQQIPGIGLYQSVQFWLALAVVHHTYPKHLDTCWALAGPGSRRGLNWLYKFPVGLFRASNSLETHPFFLKHTRELQHLLLSHPDLTVRRGDNREIKKCKEELKNLLLRPDGVNYLLCEYQRVVAWMRAHPE